MMGAFLSIPGPTMGTFLQILFPLGGFSANFAPMMGAFCGSPWTALTSQAAHIAGRIYIAISRASTPHQGYIVKSIRMKLY